MIKIINWIINKLKNYSWFKDELISDGYHSFDDLYEIRKAYNAAFFNELARTKKVKCQVHKTWKHNDGEWCFGEEKKHFKVSAMLPGGEVSNHYKAEDWDLFKVPVKEKCLFKFEGHTGKDTVERLKDFCLSYGGLDTEKPKVPLNEVSEPPPFVYESNPKEDKLILDTMDKEAKNPYETKVTFPTKAAEKEFNTIVTSQLSQTQVKSLTSTGTDPLSDIAKGKIKLVKSKRKRRKNK